MDATWYQLGSAEGSEGGGDGFVAYAVRLDAEGELAEASTVIVLQDSHLCVRSLELQPLGALPRETLSRFGKRVNEEKGYEEVVDHQTFIARKAPKPLEEQGQGNESA